MRAGVALMIIFVHLMVLSLVQDHTWLVLDLPGARSHRSMRQGNNQPPRTIKEAREERGIDNDEAAAQETAAVVDEVPEGDAVEVEAAEAVEVTVVDPEGDGI